ncbi:MAG: VacJ family lipoprotein [Methylobacillus sp.]|jgi:phospholipid-binding lipoprotein MlaA|nr:VacJ family lipoprotein [Methylobacillus sp.]
MNTTGKLLLVGTMLLTLLSGCATQGNRDPLESMNRGIYKFNDTVDNAAIKPVAGAYKAVVPSPIRTGVNNFFTNLGTVVTVINDLLQFKLGAAMNDAGRFVINSTFGIAGIFDVASMDGVEKNNNDFGQTLAVWGWENSAYLVLPFLGPSTVRDAGGLAVDSYAFDPIYYVDHVPTRNTSLAVKFVDRRSQYLPASDLLDEAALDPYAFMRDAYLQRRDRQIHGEENDNAPQDHWEDSSAETPGEVAAVTDSK